MFAVLPLAFAVASALAGDAAFEDAMRSYKALEYEEAIPKLDAIAKRPDLSASDKATAFLWLGLSHAGAGDMDSARVSLKAALVADRTIALPDKVSPRITSMFAALQEEIASETPPPPPPPEETPPPPADEPLDPMLIGGGVAAGIGAIAIAGGAVLAILAASALDTANDPTEFQQDAKAALDTANAETAGAAVLLPVGAALATAGAVILGMSLSE